MDFEPSSRTSDLQDRLQAFMDEHVYPAEPVYDAQVAAAANPHEQPQVMRDLQDKRARARPVEPLHDPRLAGAPG